MNLAKCDLGLVREGPSSDYLNNCVYYFWIYADLKNK